MSPAPQNGGHLQSAKDILAGAISDSWDYPDAKTQYLTHNIHRYSGKFIPQIAARAIVLLTQQGELVVDPYCGSGTTLLEALLLGRRALGVDLNPLAVLIARTKITPIPPHQLNRLRQQIAEALIGVDHGVPPPLFRESLEAQESLVENDPRYHDEWFRKWFKHPILSDLISIDLAINRVPDSTLQNVARVAFSDILRKFSNAHSGYPNVMFDRDAPTRPSPIRPYLKALDRICEMVASLGTVKATWSDATVVSGSAEAIPLNDCSVDAVVSHPPYIGSIPYAEYGALSLKWLGTDPKHLDKHLTGGRRQTATVVDRFRAGYAQMLVETERILRPGRFAFLMVGNPVVRGERIDLAQMTLELACRAGLQLVVRTERRGTNRRANKMESEQLLFFMKPPNPTSPGTARRHPKI